MPFSVLLEYATCVPGIDSLKSRYLRRPPLAIIWPLRLLSALNRRREILCSKSTRTLPHPPPLFFLLFFCCFLDCFFACFFCAHQEQKAPTQALIATQAVSTYRKHSRTACNRPCTERQSVYSSKSVLNRHQSAITQTDRASVAEREPSCTSILFCVSFSPLC